MSHQINLSGAEFVADFISTPNLVVNESNYQTFSERLKEEISKKPKSLRISYTGRLSHDFYTKIANEIAESLDKIDLEDTEIIPDEVFKLMISVKGDKEEFKEYPKTLFMELTRNCNGLCAMCTRQKYKELQKYDGKWNMPFSLFKKIADELFPHADYVDLRGFGESTMLPNFLDFLDYTKKFGCGLGLVTNLTVRDDKIWEELVKANVHLGISFDGSTK